MTPYWGGKGNHYRHNNRSKCGGIPSRIQARSALKGPARTSCLPLPVYRAAKKQARKDWCLRRAFLLNGRSQLFRQVADMIQPKLLGCALVKSMLVYCLGLTKCRQLSLAQRMQPESCSKTPRPPSLSTRKLTAGLGNVGSSGRSKTSSLSQGVRRHSLHRFSDLLAASASSNGQKLEGNRLRSDGFPTMQQLSGELHQCSSMPFAMIMRIDML